MTVLDRYSECVIISNMVIYCNTILILIEETFPYVLYCVKLISYGLTHSSLELQLFFMTDIFITHAI